MSITRIPKRRCPVVASHLSKALEVIRHENDDCLDLFGSERALYFGWIDVTLAKRAFLVIAYSVHALHAIRTQDVSTAKSENVLVHCQFIANWTHRHALE